MIKKYFKPLLRAQLRHRLSVQISRASALTLSKKPSGQLINHKSINSPNHNRRLAFNTVSLIVLQGFLWLPAQAASPAKLGQQVLMIEMTPALCNLQPSRARMRQCLEGYSLTVSGLELGYGERCGRGSDPRLTPLQLKVVNRIMPDTAVRTQAWQRYGACSPLTPSSYFRQIVNYAGQLKLPNELNTGNSYTVSKSRFVGQMARLNNGMSPSSIDLICQKDSKRRQSILTDVHVCYEGGQFASCNNIVDNCGKNFIILGGK